MVTLQNAENALKSVYLGTVTELLNTKVNPLLTKIEQTSSDVWGKEIRKAACWGINGGVGAGDEDGDLPKAHSNNYVQFVTTLKNLYGQIEISDKAIRASADGKGAFTDLLNAELEGLLTASKFNMGRMLYGDGSGKLCEIRAKSGTSSANETVVSAQESDGSYNVVGTNNLIEGLVVDVYSPTGSIIETGLRIARVDRDGNKIKFSSSPTSTVTGKCALYVQGSKDKEITGLGALFSDKDIYGLSRADYPFLKPYTKNINGLIDEIVLQEAIDRLEMTAGSEVDYIACSASAKYAFQDYMAQYKRNIDVMELAGGFKTLSYNGIPLVYDRFAEDGSMYLLNTSAFKLHCLCDWRFLETENGRILRQTAGKPTFTATLVKYCDLVCDKPNGQAKISGIRRS